MMISNIPDDVASSIAKLCASKRFERKIPSPLDHEFFALTELFLTASGAQREQMSLALSEDCKNMILELGNRLAIWAARTENSKLLVGSVVAHAIQGEPLDSRENILKIGPRQPYCRSDRGRRR